MEQKGIGKKLAIYVPREDEFVITALEKMIEKSRAEGYRTSFSYQFVKAAKFGLEKMGVDIQKEQEAWAALLKRQNSEKKAKKSS
jgi:hypothetical protein